MLGKYRQELFEAGIDYDQAIDRFAGDVEFYEEMIFKFLADTHYNSLVQALQAGDISVAYRDTHTLKGIVGNLSFSCYFQAIDVVGLALYEKNLGKAKSLMPAVEEAHYKIVSVLQKYQA